jgi:plastocyanin
MRKRIAILCLAVTVLVHSGASAATLSLTILDSATRGTPNAVVELSPVSGGKMAGRAPDQAIIDQRHETFLPLVVAVRKGGHVIFTNNDVTKHQVYSFSAIKQFQFVISQGETSLPIRFDQTGIAAIGCNIHDQMIAYVFVADGPFATVTGRDGSATISDIPPGRYRVAVWHPQSHVQAPEEAGVIEISGDAASWTGHLPFQLADDARMSHMHMGY